MNEFENTIKMINNLIISDTYLINTLSDDSMFKKQMQDQELREIISILRNENPNRNNIFVKYIFENFSLKNNILCKYIDSNKNLDNFVICIPFGMILQILEQYHDLSTSAHLGIKRTIIKLNERFYWPNMNKYINYYIKSCELCQYRKSPKMRAQGLMQPIVTGSVFEMVAIDHLGPFVKSNGYQYIIVLTDNFSKLAICKPVATTNAKSVAKFLFEDLILTYACIPQKILSDCSQSFIGKIVSNLNILMGIKQVKTSGYRPSTNSVTERYNGTLAHCLSMYVNEKQTNWSKYVKSVVFAYNCTVQASSGYSPIKIVFGRKAQLPPDVNNQLTLIKGTVSDYTLGLAKYLRDVRENVFENLMKSHSRDKIRYDMKHRNVQYSKGNRVLFYNPAIFPGRVNKLLKRWEGPYKIVRQLSPLLYELDFKGTALKSNIVHISRIKLFYDREDLMKTLEQNRKPFIPKTVLKQKTFDENKNFENLESFKNLKDLSKNSIDNKSESENQYSIEQNSTIDSGSDSDSDSDINTDMYENISFSNSSSDSENTEEYYHSVAESPSETESQTPEPNFNVEQGVRRSQRVRFAPNKLNLYFSTIICLLSFIANANCLANVEPIIWHKVDNPVVEGLDTVTTVIDYKSPCYLFKELLIDSDTTNELKNWCQNLFKTDFIEPINSFCTSIGDKQSQKFG